MIVKTDSSEARKDIQERTQSLEKYPSPVYSLPFIPQVVKLLDKLFPFARTKSKLFRTCIVLTVYALVAAGILKLIGVI